MEFRHEGCDEHRENGVEKPKEYGGDSDGGYVGAENTEDDDRPRASHGSIGERHRWSDRDKKIISRYGYQDLCKREVDATKDHNKPELSAIDSIT